MQPSDATQSRWFRQLGESVLRHRWALLAANLLVTLYLGSQIPRLLTDTSYKAMMISASEAARTQERLEDLFGVDALFMVVVEGDVFSRPYIEKLAAFQAELASMDMQLASLGKRDLRDPSGRILVRARDRKQEKSTTAKDDFAQFGEDEGWGQETGGSIVDELVSIRTVRDVRNRDGGLVVKGLLEDDPLDAGSLASAKRHALSNKSMVGHVVGFEGRHSVLMIRTDFMDSEDSELVDDAIRRIGAKYDADDFRVRYSGVPALTAELNRYLMSDIGTMNAIGFALMVLLLGWLFRHPVGVIGPLLVVAQATLWTVGLMAITRTPMTVISTIIPSFLICVGIGDSVHMLSVYRQDKAVGMTNHQAIVAAVAETGRPVLFTTLTTWAGLFSFRFASLDAIRDFGLFGGIGVLLALLESLVFLPILLSFAPRGRFGLRAAGETKGPGTRLADRVLLACNGLSRGARRNRALVVVGVLTAVCAFGASRVRVHHNPLDWMPAGGQARQAVAMLDGHVGGSSDMLLMIEAKPGSDLRDLETMRRLEKLEKYVLDYPADAGEAPLVRTSTGILDVLRESRWALEGEAPGARSLPTTQQGVVDLFTLFENASPAELRRLMTVDAQTALMIVRMRWVEAARYKPLDTYLQRGIRDIMGEQATVHTTGTVYQAIQSDNAIVGDLLSSFAVAICVISVLMVLMLGDLRLGLIAMLPNLLPIAAVLAFMGFAGVGLDMSNLMIASIGIGIAVDDTVHYLYHFKAHYHAHGDRERAIDHAFLRAGNAMISTSVILLAGFLVFTAATLSNLQVFGLLISLTVALALAIDLAFTPALLRLAFAANRPGARPVAAPEPAA